MAKKIKKPLTERQKVLRGFKKAFNGLHDQVKAMSELKDKDVTWVLDRIERWSQEKQQEINNELSNLDKRVGRTKVPKQYYRKELPNQKDPKDDLPF